MFMYDACPARALATDDLRQERFGRGVAMKDIVLATLLVVHDKLDGDAGALRPVGGTEAVRPVTDHVARIAISPSVIRTIVSAPLTAIRATLRQDRRLLQPASGLSSALGRDWRGTRLDRSDEINAVSSLSKNARVQ